MARMSDGGAAEPRLGAMAWATLAVDWIRDNPNRPPEKAGVLYRQLPFESPSKRPVLDLAVDRGNGRLLKEWSGSELYAAVELKWTGMHFRKQVAEALSQLQDVSAKQRVVVVGSPRFSLASGFLLFLKSRPQLQGATPIFTIATESGDAVALFAYTRKVRWIVIVGAISAFPRLLGHIMIGGIPQKKGKTAVGTDSVSIMAREALGDDLGGRLLDRLEEHLKPWWATNSGSESEVPSQAFGAVFGEEYSTGNSVARTPRTKGESDREPEINWLALLQSPWNALTAEYLRLVQRSIRRERWRELIEVHVRTLLEGIERPLPEGLSSRGSVSPMPIRLGVKRNGRLWTRYGRTALTILSGKGNRKDLADPISREALLVLGSAGVGKTTVLESIFKGWIEEAWIGGEVALIPLVPVWLDLQELTENDLVILDENEITIEQHRTIVEFLVRNAAARAKSSEGTSSSALPGLASLLQVAPLVVVIDGWDQIAAKPLLRERVRLLLRALAGVQFSNVRKIILSSRPSPEVNEVLRGAIRGGRRWTMVSLWLDAPNDQSRRAYVQEWFSFAKTPLDRNDRRRNLWAWAPFSAWFDRSFSDVREVEKWHRILLAGHIQSNPLLLTLALIVYFERTNRNVGPGEELRPFGQIAELFETLFEQLRMRDDSTRKAGDPAGRPQEILLPFSPYDSETFRPLLEALCFETLTEPRSAIGALIPSALLSDGTTVGSRLSVLKDKLGKMGWPSFSSLPFLFSRDVVQEDTWEFIHPSFHEYFAACHAAAVLLRSEGKEAPVGSRVVESAAAEWRNADTVLGEVFLKLGREGFQFLLSRLLLCIDQYESPNLRDRARRTLRRMADVISHDLTIQQYLYDTGFVDVAAFELYEWWRLLQDPVSRDRVTAEGRLAVTKLVAHFHYGRKDGQVDGRPIGRGLGLEMMGQALEDSRRLQLSALTDKEEGRSGLFGWYADFFDDHILNRQEVPSAPIATDLAIEKKWAGFDPQGGGLQALFEKNDGRTESAFSLLRAAHFFGHRANHSLIWFTRASQGGTLTPQSAASNFEFGRRAAERAITLRVAALAMTNGGRDALLKIEKIADSAFVTGSVTHTILQELKDNQKIESFAEGGVERFASVAQGIGDLANQHVVFGVLLLWRWLFFEGDSAARIYGEARSVVSLSIDLWTLAGETGVRATHNDGAIRYLIYLAGLQERLRIAEAVVERGRVPTNEESKVRLESEISRLEQDYGLAYEIGGESTPRDVEVFAAEVRRRRLSRAVRRALSQG